MEDRKRPAIGSTDDLAPPSKRVAVNGAKVKDDSSEMKEEGWIEAYSKGAIYRQMQEYSRKAATAESRLEELHKRCVHHDDHLRVIDAWWRQRGQLSPDAAALEGKVTTLLAAQKDYLLKLDRLNVEKENLSEELNAATLRYFKAEKKLDRAKSAQVQKLEQKAFANATRPPAASSEGIVEAADANGNTDDLLLKFDEATAAAAKQKEQLDGILSEVKTLQDENLSLKARRELWTDEDFVRSDVFKQFKGQNEDLIKRINNLEATNKQLREEAEKLQAERSAFKAQLEADANQVTQELEADIVARDQDLARVRSTRDEILADNSQRKASMEQDKTALDHIRDLVNAKDDRIVALESEIVRLKPVEDKDMASPEAPEMSEEELRQKYKKLLKDFQSINEQLPSIEKSYKRMKDMAQIKIMDFAALEEKVALLIAEKGKADQKYFAARKDADTRNNEIRSLRHQNSKSSEIIAQLKALEVQNRTLLVNLEKQLSDLKQANSVLALENKKLDIAATEAARRADSLTRQIEDLSNLVKSRDAASAVVRERNTMQEAEVEKLRVRVEHAQKDRDNWRNKALSNSSEEEEMLRVSRPSFCPSVAMGANEPDADFCVVHDLPQQLQEHGSEDVWTPLLQQMCGGSHQQPDAQVSDLLARIRQDGRHACSSLIPLAQQCFNVLLGY
ncbi:RING-12 protein [Drechmeria coniospora]|uniref:E3 ubiquitin protein ligase n=1 Tax=Drechmeria coniospora TaxID=98403 RepID=A0A151GKY7_DRECN|nr:RING-12 protein [Drechmeria coniospora]KYK57770.1 RING-12 protein [Drechmeria coniospora]